MTKLPKTIRSASLLAMMLSIASLASAQSKVAGLFPVATAPELVGTTAGIKPTIINITTDVLRILGLTSGSSQALRVQTAATTSPSWNSALRWKSTSRVAKDDRIQVSFMLRSVVDSPVDKRLKIAFVDRKNQGSRILETLVYNPTTVWKKVEIGVKSWDTYAAGDLLLEMWLGLDKQNFEIANIQITDLGPNVDESTLRNTVRYPGSHPSAPWRTTAAARIKANRTGAINVKVVDGSGTAISGATVRAKMNKSAFEFGTAVNAGAISNTLQPGNSYQSTFLANFNAAVFENDTKWAQYIGNGWKEWDGTNNPYVIGAASFLKNQGVHLRGHNLVWPSLGLISNSYYYMPPDLTKTTAAATIRTRTNNHIKNILQNPVIDDLFDEWDVLNEAYDNVDLQGTLAAGGKTATNGILGNAEMTSWFKQVNQYAPAKKTFYNNFSTIEGNDVNRIAYDKALIQYVRANGGRVDGVGLQSHFTGGTADDPTTLYNDLQDWATQNVRLKVTEFDMAADDPDGVANFLRDYLTTCYSNSNVDGFYLWGFWSRQMYQSRSALFDAGMSPTPAGKVWMSLMKQWSTDATVSTNSSGVAATSGYTGSYTITVTKGNKTTSVPLDLTTAGKSITVTLS